MSVLNLVSSVAQTLSPLLYAAFIVVVYFQLRAGRASVREVQQEFLAAGRPVVAVHDEFDHHTRGLNIAVENVGHGPAKDISFAFSHPIDSSDHTRISDLPLFTTGLTSLAPGARITCYWDDLDAQLRYLRRSGLAGSDITVTVRYSDLPGAQYCHSWDIQPAVYEGLRPPRHAEQHVTDQAGESPSTGGDTASPAPRETTGEPVATAGVGAEES